MKTANPIAALFGRSPFGPTQEHMRLIQSAVAQLPALVEALGRADASDITSVQDAIRAPVTRASALARDIRLHLPRSLFMPVDRRDLLELLDRQEWIGREVRAIADLPLQHAGGLPTDLHTEVLSLTRTATETCRQATAIVDEIDELIETGFRGPEATRVETMIQTLDRLAAETDAQIPALALALFAPSKDAAQADALPPATPQLAHQFVRALGALANRAARIGDHLLPLIAR
jgi:predicted phosphate transport protein (TIGR00153 family)